MFMSFGRNVVCVQNMKPWSDKNADWLGLWKNLSVHDKWVAVLSAVLVGNASIYERRHLFVKRFSNLVAEDFIKLKE